MEEEWVDILNANGSLTGDARTKAEAHRLGLPHATVHVWFYTRDQRILFQKRAASKDTFPDLWDISVAGHIHAGEAIVDAALREIEEEIGITVTKDKLHKIGVHEDRKVHAEDLIDHEFHQVFICELTVPLDQLRLQTEEVSAVDLVPCNIFLKAVETGEGSYDFVANRNDYYHWVVEKIKLQCQSS